MLSDQQLEDLLRRYRVVDPPHELGLSIARTASAEEPVHAWLWGPAVAAAVLITWLAVQVSMLEGPMDAVRDAEVVFASEMLGGGEGATDYARVIVPGPDDQEAADSLTEETWQRP
jgi:hypothetical protein